MGALPLDYCAHLLSDCDQLLGVLKGRCGHLLPMIAAEQDHPPDPLGAGNAPAAGGAR